MIDIAELQNLLISIPFGSSRPLSSVTLHPSHSNSTPYEGTRIRIITDTIGPCIDRSWTVQGALTKSRSQNHNPYSDLQKG